MKQKISECNKLLDEYKEKAEIAKSNIAVSLGEKRRGVFSVGNPDYEVGFNAKQTRSFTKSEQATIIKDRPQVEALIDKYTVLSVKKDCSLKKLEVTKTKSIKAS